MLSLFAAAIGAGYFVAQEPAPAVELAPEGAPVEQCALVAIDRPDEPELSALIGDNVRVCWNAPAAHSAPEE